MVAAEDLRNQVTAVAEANLLVVASSQERSALLVAKKAAMEKEEALISKVVVVERTSRRENSRLRTREWVVAMIATTQVCR